MTTIFSPDADTENADWTKQTWDYPPYKSAEFFQLIDPRQLEWFRNSPAYQGAVDAGLIHDDEWVADWVQPADPPKRRQVRIHLHDD